MKAVDTSVAVAAFGDWHELNESARAVLDQGVGLPAHCLLETYSVLTGFPPPHRAASDLVDEWLRDRFERVLPAPAPEDHRQLISRLARERRVGGSVYDGLVALTALRAGSALVTADEHAAAIYDLVGVQWELLR